MIDTDFSKKAIEAGNTSLGIEFGSTRIKAVLIDENFVPIASGSHEWENRYENNIWTYSLDDIWNGLKYCYTDLTKDVERKYKTTLKTIGSIGISAMMHGYLPFDRSDRLLTPFRTWRNTMTEEASQILTANLGYNIPQRWSISHLYQAILNQEEHVKDIAYITTLAGYIHFMLTGEKVLGVGDASGMFPITAGTKEYSARMVTKFNGMIAAQGFNRELKDILPAVLMAGEDAGKLTNEGAALLDPSGNLIAGIPLCPPEGDAGTGMAATNSVAERTGNVSAGTSVFAMIVLEEELGRVYPEIDLVTTPAGSLVGMVHCNNCTSDLNSWVSLFKEFTDTLGIEVTLDKVYNTLYTKALEGDIDVGGMLAYNYFSGEHITGFSEGRPLFVRRSDGNFNLANFMRTHLFTSLGALKIGLDILLKQEGVKVDRIFGHGGLFKTEGVGQSFLAAAMNAPVSVMETAGEGGAWGIALLASYLRAKDEKETLDEFLGKKVFVGGTGKEMRPDPKVAESFDIFIERYKTGLKIEQAAVSAI
ncbi:MAG: FGGY-family carbohydrate kinase [Lachnospiraceae bacterium]|nr:FGGY-family carbohydrate kinase [Lachnospiraceae bacterium]